MGWSYQKNKTIRTVCHFGSCGKGQGIKSKRQRCAEFDCGRTGFCDTRKHPRSSNRSNPQRKASYYTPTAGIPELRQAIVDYLKKNYGLVYEPSQTVVTDGAKFALYTLFQTILDPQDEVIIPVPYWVSYGEQVKLAEGLPVFVKGKNPIAGKLLLNS